MTGWIVNNELHGRGRKWSWRNLMYHPCTWLDGLTKMKKTLNQNARCPGRSFNRSHAKKMKVRDIIAWAGFKKIKPKQITIPCRGSPVQSIISVRSKLTSSSISTDNSIRCIQRLKVTTLGQPYWREDESVFCPVSWYLSSIKFTW